ncbi:methyltransferase TYW3-domain-containing protein [Poronia punctata]|nr:methyltransferase TYW3-domain-containing protein [Poronia punctata]
MGLPSPPTGFVRRKDRILEQLAVPDSEYSDASPKGSVDEGIRELIAEINALEGFVTTSSCAGRVSVFVEGRKAVDDEEGTAAATTTVAAVGGKGGGGAWLFVSHDSVPVEGEGRDDVKGLLGLCDGGVASEGGGTGRETEDKRLIHFKFEPMILHVLTASLEHAQLLLRCGLQAGFRESGAINLTPTSSAETTPIVAIRSMGLSLESLIGVREGGNTKCTVSDEYLLDLVRIANGRFVENARRITRFREALAAGSKLKNDDWEDAQARRERKRAEGLRRKAELLQGQDGKKGVDDGGDMDLGFDANMDIT